MLVYDINTNSFWYSNGSEWLELITDPVFIKDNGVIRNNGDLSQDDFLFGSTDLPVNGTQDTLFFFDISTGAFRSGRMNGGNAWMQDSLGAFSFASGEDVRASGTHSAVFGKDSWAEGDASFAFGANARATAPQAIALGSNNEASGLGSLATGNQTDAAGQFATSMGNLTEASGSNSIATGSQTKAMGGQSTAMGIQSEAVGSYSVAMGRTTKAEAHNSTAIGRFNVGGGSPFSWEENEPLFEIGNGDDANNLSNAMTILKNGNVGIGTHQPEEKLDVDATTRIKMNSSTSSPHLILHENSTNDYSRLVFQNDNEGTSWTIAGSPRADTISSRMNFYLKGQGNLVTIRGNGRMGINNTNPSDRLQIDAAQNESALRVRIDGSTKLRVHQNGGTSIGADNPTATPSNGLYVSGNTGIGVAAPAQKLEVNGGVKIGYTTVEAGEGVLRYDASQNNFEGYDGNNWSAIDDRKNDLEIGDVAFGGIVFWLDESGEHGLVAAEMDQSPAMRWGAGTDGVTRARGRGPYAGEMNTAIIISSQVAIGDDGANFAAQFCADQWMNGFGDWYLPSRDELFMMLDRLHLEGLGNFLGNYYWSSTEYSDCCAWGRNFNTGSSTTSGKNNLHYVRAIRAF